MRQGARSVAEYSIEFCTLFAVSGWNEPTLQTVFLQGLNDSVPDALALGARPANLNKLIDRAIILDTYQRERWSMRRQASPQHLPLPPVASDSRNSDEEPMQLGRAQLSSCERCR